MAKKKKNNKKKSTAKRIVILIVTLVLLTGIFYLMPKIISVVKMYQEAQRYVNSSTVSTFMDSKTTLIYDTDGNELCTMKNSKDLYYVKFSEIPTTLAQSFIVMEDKSFYKHSGIDFKAIIRAVIANQKSTQISQGASTITQQLAKNIFLTQEVTWQRKVEEIFIATQLEKKYSKDQILEFYLNNIYFGNGYYGVEAAARGYFSKSVADLTLKEQAFIAAIPNNPSRYNPLNHFDNTMERANRVLDQLYDQDEVSSMDYYSAQKEDVELNPMEDTSINDSVVTYVRHCATESLMKSMGFKFRYSFNDDDDYNAYQDSYETYYTQCQQKLISGGYSVYTSINMNIQNQLQEAVDKNLAVYKDVSSEGIYTMQGAATCIDNNSGNVVAIVGSRSQDGSSFGLNRAYQSYRQPGSSIKPLSVYLPYLQTGKTPDTMVSDTAIEGGPANADGVYSGDMTLRDAVKWSKNTVAWKVYQEITPRAGCSFLTRMGFKKVWVDKEYNAAALGGFTYGVTTEEMAGGYAAIENDGVYRRPTCVTKILNSTGHLVIGESNREEKIYEVNASRMMTDMLVTVVNEGTGTAANVSNAIVAGKTGTTNSNKDSWFCGFSKYYSTAVWIGYDYPKEISGGSQHVNAIFKDFMTNLHEGLAKAEFSKYSLFGADQQTEKETEIEKETEKENLTDESTTETQSVKDPVIQPATTKPAGKPGSDSDNKNEITTTVPNNSGTTNKPTLAPGDHDATGSVPPGEWDNPDGVGGDVDAG